MMRAFESSSHTLFSGTLQTMQPIRFDLILVQSEKSVRANGKLSQVSTRVPSNACFSSPNITASSKHVKKNVNWDYEN